MQAERHQVVHEVVLRRHRIEHAAHALGLVGLEQNKIIKLFSVVAVVFMPPTLVASIYGMNFEKMPELKWEIGYPLSLGIMVVAAILPYLFFRWKKWL